MIRKLNAYQATVMADRKTTEGGVTTTPRRETLAAPPSPIFTPEKESTTRMATAGGSTRSSSGGSPSSGSWVDVSMLRDALQDPKQRLLENLESLSGEINWKLPAGTDQRVAPNLLVKLYSKYGSACRFARSFIDEKQLERHHVGQEMMLHCMVLDRMIAAQPDFATTQGCEMVCRRIYGLKRAFADVHQQSDWKQPKGQAKWRSKVRWDLANELDWRALEQDDEHLPEVERELQLRMRDKALAQRYLDTPQQAGEDGE